MLVHWYNYLILDTTDTPGNIKTTQYNVTVALDNTAPVITASLQRDTATGGVTNTDKITFDPTITGTVIDASDVVEFKAGLNNAIAANFVSVLPYRNSNGSFIFDRTLLNTIYGGGNVLPDGQHTLKLVAKDKYGNVSVNDEFTFTLDTTTPTPILSLVGTSDTGISQSDRITNDNTPTITGNGEVGATVQLFNGTQVVGQTTVNSSGIWQITTSPITDGVKSLSAIASDIAGNTSTSTPIGITVDTLLPQLTLTTPQINLTTPINNAPLATGAKLIGNVDGTGSGISSLRYRFDNTSEIAITLNSTGNFNQQLDLSTLTSGSHVLTLVATDIAGNVKTISYNVTINNDTIPPVITAGLKNDTAPSGTININPNDGKLSDTPSESLRDRITYDPSITGFVTDTSSIASFKAGFNNQTAANFVDVFAQLNTDGSFNFNRTTLEAIYGGTIPDGTHTLRLIASDSYGNTSNALALLLPSIPRLLNPFSTLMQLQIRILLAIIKPSLIQSR
jgi:Bacterial Ig-like domain/Bacterial Ig-like domain (group 3)